MKLRNQNIALVAFFIFIFCSDLEVFAQSQRQLPAHEILEYSLMSLKESANEVSSRNKWLITESEALREKIEVLKKDLKSYDKLTIIKKRTELICYYSKLAKHFAVDYGI